jgi:hypothetical protein
MVNYNEQGKQNGWLDTTCIMTNSLATPDQGEQLQTARTTACTEQIQAAREKR